ncbi:hypothetical protein BDR04DRAFT_1086678, partial [Suillus decipiens]
MALPDYWLLIWFTGMSSLHATPTVMGVFCASVSTLYSTFTCAMVTAINFVTCYQSGVRICSAFKDPRFTFPRFLELLHPRYMST